MVRENKHPSMKQLKILKIIRTKFIKKTFFHFSSSFAAQLWLFVIGVLKGEIGNSK